MTDEPDQTTPDDSQVAGIVDYFFEAGTLKRLPRTGWLNAGINAPETIAEHSHRTGLIGAVLAIMEGADPAKVAFMGVIHDTQETRIGDIAYIGRRYLKAADNRDVTADQTAEAPPAVRDALAAIVDEIESYETSSQSSTETPTSLSASSRPSNTARPATPICNSSTIACWAILLPRVRRQLHYVQ